VTEQWHYDTISGQRIVIKVVNVPINYENSKMFTHCVYINKIQINSVMNKEVGRPLHAVSCNKE
jgi:hypothetical protein